MQSFKCLIAGLFAALAVPVMAAPVAAVSKPVSRATLQKPLQLTRLADLDFGTVVTSGLSGTAFIDATSGARTLTGGLSAGPSNFGQRATFSLTGAPGQNVILIVMPPPALANGVGDLVPVLALTLDGSPVRTIDAATGSLQFGVGGIITVSADQPDGVYAANFDVTAIYF